jgi:oxalate decarboxylase/phosphoglucose isomerase-like protein (cupin superfamily)
MVVLPTGLLGVEFTKSHIYGGGNQSKDINCIIEVVKGGATILLQKNKPPEEYEIETTIRDFIVAKVKSGEKFPIPSGFQYSFINTRNYPLVLSRIYKYDGRIDYRTLRREQGLGYYVIRKNARQEYVKNPRYRETPKLRTVKPETYARKYKVSSTKPLYMQLVENPTRFKDLLT